MRPGAPGYPRIPPKLEESLRPATTIVILVLLLLIAVAGVIFVVQLLFP